MMRQYLLPGILFSLFALLVIPQPFLSAAIDSQGRSFDVVVYGGTPAGIVAAVTAAGEGASVALLEPTQHLGGMASGGLGHTDIGNADAIGGHSRAFFERVGKHYGESLAWYFEPHVAEQVFTDWLAEAKVPVFLGCRLLESSEAVAKDGASIRTITMENGERFVAKCFVDASYEGDLMARAGVSYVTGREGQEEFKESLAGVQPVPLGDLEEYQRTAPPHGPGHTSLMFPTITWYKARPNYLNTHQWPVRVRGLDSQGDLLPGVTAKTLGEPGTGDEKFMAYNFRLCLSDVPENRIPIEKPAGYDPLTYEILARYVAQWPDIKLGQIFHIARMPTGKSDFNTSGPYSTDYLGANWDYPEASYARRQEIWEDHKNFLQGMFYFLVHDPRLPESLRNEAAQWGLSKDEFIDTDNWPRQLYVRVCRRMRGEFVMTQRDVEFDIFKDDSVGMGSFVIDSHNIQRIAAKDGSVVNEGGIEVPVTPYQISYGALVPQAKECGNLLVPVCLSASYVAYCTIRMEPVYMALGQAAGLAAATVAQTDGTVQQVDIPKLQEKLLKQGAVLKLAAEKLNPLFWRELDEIHAQRVGEWEERNYEHLKQIYRHDQNAGKGEKSARWELTVPADGRYEVRLAYPHSPAQATNVPVKLVHAEGEQTFLVNQQQVPEMGAFIKLGTFRFTRDKPAVVFVENKNTQGYVAIDRVHFIPVEID
jgi:hypothetical protein